LRSGRPPGRRWALAAALALAAGCQRDRVRAHLEEPWPELLSEWRLFRGNGSTLEPSPGVLPYEVAAPLFSDYADKHRTVWMPEGTSARYDGAGVFAMPVGTILSKTFTYPIGGSRRLIETRLLVHGRQGWVALPYVWNEAGTEARLEIVGAIVPVDAQPGFGPVRPIRYVVPNMHQCQGCHEQRKALVPIGIQARHLNRPHAAGGQAAENQLARWSRHGYLTGAPEPPERAPRHPLWERPEEGDLDARARAYLDVNCAHCHSPEGPASSTGLDLRSTTTDPRSLGICKPPVAAGRGTGPGMAYDIVPGAPEASILVYRMRSTDPGVMMPELGRTVVHAEGVQLVSEWVRSLAGSCDT
jgi:uncharacterized repeat protein (TIGR03806 family)